MERMHRFGRKEINSSPLLNSTHQREAIFTDPVIKRWKLYDTASEHRPDSRWRCKTHTNTIERLTASTKKNARWRYNFTQGVRTRGQQMWLHTLRKFSRYSHGVMTNELSLKIFVSDFDSHRVPYNSKWPRYGIRIHQVNEAPVLKLWRVSSHSFVVDTNMSNLDRIGCSWLYSFDEDSFSLNSGSNCFF